MQRIIAALWGILFVVAAHAGPVDINSADSGTLARELNGIGVSRAQAIVEYRQQFGPFRSAEDLLNVSGIGEHILEANRENIVVDSAQP